jgi:hypothetical protein
MAYRNTASQAPPAGAKSGYVDLYAVLPLAARKKNVASTTQPAKNRASKTAPLPIRLAPSAPIKDAAALKSFEKLLAEPVPLDRDAIAPVLVNDKGERAKPRTCREYFDLEARGFFAATTADMTGLSVFIERCDALTLLKDAVPARKSFVQQLKLDAATARQLPASLIPPSVAETMDDKRDDASRHGKAIGDAFPKAKFKPDAPYQVEIRANDWIVVVTVQAWADFDRDGLEDVLLFTANYIDGGTLRCYGHELITRRSANGKIELLKRQPTTAPTGGRADERLGAGENRSDSARSVTCTAKDPKVRWDHERKPPHQV